MRIQDLDVAYDGKTILSGVNLPIMDRSVTAIVGPSGCGKSSLLRCMNRLNDSIPGTRVRGNIRRGTEDILLPETDVNRLRREIGIVFQKPGPFPFSIRKNFSIPLNEHGVRGRELVEERMREALELTGLWPEVRSRLNKNARLLSGGQQQRLCIARSLALRPRLLLLDEPCGSLDPVSTRVIEELIAELKRNHAVVVVTHNLGQARRIADYLGVMHDQDGVGALLEYGAAACLFEEATHPLAAAYLRER